MIDFGFDKLAVIGTVALIVIGPEKLPKVARTVGTLMGKARRYVADVKAEVNRSIELEELQKMKTQFEGAAQDMQQSMNREFRETQKAVNEGLGSLGTALDDDVPDWDDGLSDDVGYTPAYHPPRKNWRAKRSAVPSWYKHRAGVRRHVQSGAARVARHRPPGLKRS
jgi:sec-independent protein translocase protein TatB